MKVIIRNVVFTLLASTPFSLNASAEFNFQNLITEKSPKISEYIALTPLFQNKSFNQNSFLSPQFAAISWIGAIDSDWFDAGNWSGGVPGAGDSVTIATNDPNSPVINATSAVANSLVLNGTGVLSIVNGGTLTINTSSNIGQLASSNSSVLSMVLGAYGIIH